jgi:hypothetical protein
MATTEGTLFGKNFIPFRKEGDIGDNVMTTIIQQQNNFLGSTKQRIVPNMNDIDCLIDIATCIAEDMDAATITLRDIFHQYKDDDGGQLFDAIEKTNTDGTYIFLSMSAIQRQLTIYLVIWMQHWTPLEHGMIVVSTLDT